MDAATRVATAADIDAIVDTITLAFLHDPIWGPALAVPNGATDHVPLFWRQWVERSVGISGAYVRGDAATVALWTPPGLDELTPEGDAEIERLAREFLPSQRAADLFALFDRFEDRHPHQPHAYLGFLATHPDFRGKGIGQELLADTLTLWDAQGVPTYLESSNPANNHRYERAGFHSIGHIDAVLNDARIELMWRDAR
jgi:GNAT superfamily N-acetyltransferase